MAKQCCGTCKFWDRRNVMIYGAIDKPRADCSAPVPDSIWPDDYKHGMSETEGETCPSYKKIKEK